MRRLSLLFAVLIVVPLLGSDSPKEYDDRTERVDIEGTWRLTETEKFGTKKEYHGENVQTYRNGTFTIGGDGILWLRGRFRIDPAAKPPRLDWYPSHGPEKGTTLKHIYQIDGDILRIAFTLDPDEPPQGFNDKGVDVMIYKRVK